MVRKNSEEISENIVKVVAVVMVVSFWWRKEKQATKEVCGAV